MTKIRRTVIQVCAIIVITLAFIEILLQVFYLSLPQAIIQRMPQYPERYGIRFDTSHGAREYPANEVVNFEVNQFTGDLYQISCLSPTDAIPFESYTVSYTRNEHGFRTPNLSGNNVDIAIIGDSFTAAEPVISPYWDGLGESIIVLGLPGSGTLEQHILLEEFGLPHNPDVIVLAYFGGNDLTDNMTFHDLQQQNMTFADKTNQNRNPLEYLVTFHLALFIRDALNPSASENCHYPVETNTEPPTPLAFFDTMVTLLSSDKDTLFNSEAYQITVNAIMTLAQQATKSDSQFILVYIPQKAEVYWNLLNHETQQEVTERLPKYSWLGNRDLTAQTIADNLDVQRTLLSDLANNGDFQFVDLTSTLIEAVQIGDQPYFFADTHWNQRGHDIVRQTLQDVLAQLTLELKSNS